MKYDFTTVLDRTGRDSLAADKIPFYDLRVDEGFSTIPMWIADMSFPTAPPVMEAMYKRMELPNFGYFALPPEYFSAIIEWQRRRNGIEGLLPGAYRLRKRSARRRELRSTGIYRARRERFSYTHPPMWAYHTMDDTGRVIVHSELKRDAQGVWRMDYEDMDAKLKEHIYTSRSSALPTTPAAESGSAGR